MITIKKGVWGEVSLGNATADESLAIWGLPQVDRPLLIIGECEGGQACEISGNGEMAIFYVQKGSLTLYDLILRDGKPTEDLTGLKKQKKKSYFPQFRLLS